MENVLLMLVTVVLGCVCGIFIGKCAMDSLVDTNIIRFKCLCLFAAITTVAILLSAIFLSSARVYLLILEGVLLIGYPVGFLGWIYAMVNYGLRVKWNDSVGSIVKCLVYDPEREETGYDLYLPARKSPNGKYSLILYIHGGGFTGGSRKDGASWCKYMASKGYVAASMDYTLHDGKHISNLNLMCSQVKECVSAIREKCAELGYPVTEMAPTGVSAGGCLASLFAYKEAKNSAIPVKFVFQQTGPMYFDPVSWGASNNIPMQASFVSMMTGHQITEDMVVRGEHYPYVYEISPASYVDSETVPTLCAYGPKDKMVPANLKYHLLEALEKARVPYDFVEYPHSNHGLYDDPKSQRIFLKKLDEYCARYFENHLE